MEEESKMKMLWGALPLKTKLIIIGIGVGFIFIIFFLVVMITPLMSLGIIDVGDFSGGSSESTSVGYSTISDNMSHWVPIGSDETMVVNGITFASDIPTNLVVTSRFASKESFRNKAHNGIDFGNNGVGVGVINVIASKSGRVIYPTSTSQTSYNDNGYYGNTDGGGFGNYVMIEHDDETVTVYAHLAKNSISVFSDDYVQQGQVIGKMGHSGSSTGVHLHFEVRYNGQRKNPENYINVGNPRLNSSSTDDYEVHS